MFMDAEAIGIIVGGAILGVSVLVIIIIICASIASSGNQFRENSQTIEQGMSQDEVIDIMGEPSFTKNHKDGSIEFVYEKSEWKGWLRGGTKTRRMEIVFSSDDKVISIGRNAECDMTGW